MRMQKLIMKKLNYVRNILLIVKMSLRKQKTIRTNKTIRTIRTSKMTIENFKTIRMNKTIKTDRKVHLFENLL